MTRLSTKGQIIIPLSMRKGMKQGDQFIVMREGERFVLKRATNRDKRLQEDLEFARRTEEAWQRHDRGEYKTLGAAEFMRRVKLGKL